MSGFGVNGWQTSSTFAANRFQAHLAGDTTSSDQFNLKPAIGQHENELRQLSGGWVSQVQGAGGAQGDEGSATQAGTSGQPYKVTEADGAVIPVAILPHVRAAQDIKESIETIRDNGVNAETVGSAVLGATVGKRIPNVMTDQSQPVSSPTIDPKDVAGKTASDIDKVAKDAGLISRGEPQSGKGAYVDPATGKQRVLIHPDPKSDCSGPHCHVNDAEGNRLDIEGKQVPPESPEAHLPLKTK